MDRFRQETINEVVNYVRPLVQLLLGCQWKSTKMRRESVYEDTSGNGKPFYIDPLLSVLKFIFLIYDFVMFIPFKIFADPAQKLELSNRVKAEPEVEGDAATPWQNVKNKGGKLRSVIFDGTTSLAEQWMCCVRLYNDRDCFGTREVLEIHKEKQPNGRIFEKWELGEYHWRTFDQVNRRVNMVGSGLRELGLKNKSHVVLFAETREEWMTTAFACFKCNFPIVTVYATLGEEAVEFAISEVAATTIITSENLLPKVRKAVERGANIKNVVFFESFDPSERNGNMEYSEGDVKYISFTHLLNMGQPDELEIKTELNDLAFIMYTSGTTGNPKGVMLSHENIMAATAGQVEVFDVRTSDTYIGYLPLAHILEICGEMVVMSRGVRIGYSSAQTLFDRAPKIKKGTRGDCFALKPTLMACVPAVMDRIYKAVIDEVNSNSLLFKEMFRTCYERKRSRYEEGYSSILLNKLVFNRIGTLLGGKIRVVLSGGAPLSPETQRFMNICFCCPVVQGYGLTETCGGGTLADAHDLSTGSVGPPLTCCNIKLEDWHEAGYSPSNNPPQGEILIGGKNVALGYFKNPEKTKEDFVERDGQRYFATGDIGEFREDGSLKIIDRKKDLLKLSHGEYISLGKVETNLLTNPLVDNICVYGDSNKDYLVALVVPNQKNLSNLADQLGVSGSHEQQCHSSKLTTAVQKELSQYVSGKLQRIEIPQRLYLCSEPWTPASGLLTEALKLKRKSIEKEYKEQLDSMYKS